MVCQRRYDIQVTDIKQSDTRQNSNAMQQKDEHELNSKYFADSSVISQNLLTFNKT